MNHGLKPHYMQAKITFSLTSSSASTNSSSSGLLLSPLWTTLDGRSHASFIDLRPKNNKSVIAAYSPIGNAVWMTTERNFHVKNERPVVHRDKNIIFEWNEFEDVQFDVYRFIQIKTWATVDDIIKSTSAIDIVTILHQLVKQKIYPPRYPHL